MIKIIPYVIIFIIAVSLTFLFLKQSNLLDNVRYVHDTTIVERYHTEVKQDTVIKWFEKLTSKEIKPEVVYFDRVDSVFVLKVQDLDVMLSVTKQGDKLHIYALNQNGKILKQYVYDNVGSDFTATSQNNNIFVKSKLWYWSGLKFNFETYAPLTEIGSEYNFRLSAETGISYKNKLDLNLGIERDFNTGVNSLKLKTSYKIF